MTLKWIINNIDQQNEEAIVFAKKVDDKFSPLSEAVLIELDETEEVLSTRAMAEKHCPGFDYFLEVFLIKEVLQDFSNAVGYKSLDQQIERIIHYAEFDA